MEDINTESNHRFFHFFARKKLRYLIVAFICLISAWVIFEQVVGFQPKLLIDQQQVIAEDAVVFGSENIPLLRFKATALYGDVEMGAIAITSPDGKLPHFRDFRLWIDPEQDGSFVPSLYEDDPKWHLNYVSVEAPPADGFVIEKNASVTFEIRAFSVVKAKEQFGNTVAIDFMAEPDFTYVTARGKNKKVGLLGVHTTKASEGKTFTNGLCGKTCEIIVKKSEPTKIVFIPSICGNERLEDREQCDDGNVVTGDGCSSECTIERDVSVDIDYQFSTSGGGIDVDMQSATKTHRIKRDDIDITAKRVFVTFDGEAVAAQDIQTEILNLYDVLQLKMSDSSEVSAAGYFLVNDKGEPSTEFISFADDEQAGQIEFESDEQQDFVIVFDTKEQLFPVEIQFEDGFTLNEDFVDTEAIQSQTSQPISSEESSQIIQEFRDSQLKMGNPGRATSKKFEGRLLFLP